MIWNWMAYLILALIVLWIFPAVKHFNRRFGSYFLVLALMDPLSLIYFLVFDANIELIKIPSTLILLSVFIPKEYFRKYGVIYFVFVLLVSIFGFQMDYRSEITFIAHSIIFIYLLHDVFKEYLSKDVLNVLVLMIAFYELSAIFKHFSQILEINKDYYYFHITSMFQIFFGVFFSLVGEWKIRIYSHDSSSVQEE